jgi:class 3 adenylate cyclase
LCFYLNRYLERLSKVIARSGGDVFKFAGDAMLVWLLFSSITLSIIIWYSHQWYNGMINGIIKVLWPPEAKDKENREQAIINKVHRAAQCSLDIQAELSNADLAENVRLSVKLGIGVGEVVSMLSVSLNDRLFLNADFYNLMT